MITSGGNRNPAKLDLGAGTRAERRRIGSLGQLIGTGLLTEATARAELTAAASALINADCDCTPREIARVITAGLAAGARNPRRITPRSSNQGAA